MLNREQFFAAVPPPKAEDVEVPGMGVVRVRTLTAGERCKLEDASRGKGVEGFRARIVVASVVGEDGKPLFGYEDVQRLSDTPAYVLEPIVDAAVRLNAMSAADVSELEKN
jgi:hypothetical protein